MYFFRFQKIHFTNHVEIKICIYRSRGSTGVADFTGIHSEYRARYLYRIQFSDPDFENCRSPRTCAAYRLAIVPAYRYRRVTRNPHYFSRIAFSYLFENHTRFTRQHFPMCGRIVEFLTESKFSRNIRASFFFLLSFRRSYFQRFYRSYKYYIDINSYFYKTDTPLRYFKSQTSHK